jgi:hypothetical protein
VGRALQRILLDVAARARGVKLDGAGEEIEARCVLAAAEAFQTFFGIVGRERLAPEFSASLETRSGLA